ncbi:MAG TPA: hypothetical protein VFN68_04415 [Acidimicrobiales bacterium]|nr:hypothetical protein [Acidimicrobiales bacterium]
MDHEPNPYRDPSDPAEPATTPPGRGWKVPKVAVSVGLAAFLGMAGAGAAFALGGSGGTSTSSGSSGSSTTPGSGGTAPAGPGPKAMFRHGGFGGPGMGGVLHGVFTTRNGTGFKTVEVQVGTVDTVTGTSSIKVTSADGYSQTYAIQSSTVVNSQANGISTVKHGDSVRVEAVEQGSGYTATDIVDNTRIGASRQGFGFAPPVKPGTTPSQAAPSASA